MRIPLTIITKDWKFARNIALKNTSIIFIDGKKTYQIKAERVEKSTERIS